MASEYRHRRRVDFSDTDLAGIVHFSRFFIYMESAEHAFFRSLGFSITTRIGDKKYGWPRIEAGCQYKNPLHFEDELEIHLQVLEVRSKIIRYGFSFYRIQPEPRILAAEGTMTVICVADDNREKGFHSVAIPAEIRSQLEVSSEIKV